MGPLIKVLLWKNLYNRILGKAVLWSTVAMSAVITVTPTDSEAYMLSIFYISVLFLCFGICVCVINLCVCLVCVVMCVFRYIHASTNVHPLKV